MTLQLNARARAMLQEMGVTVWLPKPTHNSTNTRLQPSAPNETVSVTAIAAASPTRGLIQDGSFAQPMPSAAKPLPTGSPLALPVVSPANPSQRRYRIRQLPAQSEHFDALLIGEPCAGDALHLLQNMVRAMHWFQPERVCTLEIEEDDSHSALPLADQIAHWRGPRSLVVFALGPHATAALLPPPAPEHADEPRPFGRLRGQVHASALGHIIPTYHPLQLLRQLPAKAKAWADLRLSYPLAPALGSAPTTS